MGADATVASISGRADTVNLAMSRCAQRPHAAMGQVQNCEGRKKYSWTEDRPELDSPAQPRPGRLEGDRLVQLVRWRRRRRAQRNGPAEPPHDYTYDGQGRDRLAMPIIVAVWVRQIGR